MRQINCSQILDRILKKRINAINSKVCSHGAYPSAATLRFEFETDFYGTNSFWTSKNNLSVRMMALFFAVVYVPYKFIIQFFLMFFGRFYILNSIVMIKRKKH